ncbi:MAG TPA: DUF1549 and DUF1553 domain-containing protein [Gemmataceae bacterium]|jgi:hypothetical protein
MRFRVSGCVILFAFAVPAVGRADEPLHERIDALIAAGHPDYDRHAAPPASDAEFLRRVYLDLNGTLPTANEVRAFLADGSADRREQLIDRLLAQPAYARRMAQHFDVTLMERRKDAKVPHDAWEAFLRTSFEQNKPYDQLVRDILSADGSDPKNRGPAKFYLDRSFDSAVVARDVGRLFLGRDLRCAQCHDHPLVEDYKQEQFYGLLAFLNRSYLFPNETAASAVVADKAEGEVTFVSVFDKTKKQHSTGPRVPGRPPVAEPKVDKDKEYKVKPAANVRPVPTYSRRVQLAAAVTDPQNRAFARTAVNRLWALMFGRGLVHPLDLDHPGNPPSHPELLDLLTDEFVAHKFDIKWLLRELALTATYQRSSEARNADAPADRYLAAPLKPLTPEQLAFALLQATGQTDAERQALGKNPAAAAVDAKLAPRVAAIRGTFAGRPGEPEDAGEATMSQALFLKYGGIVRGVIAARPGDLLDRLTKLADPNAAADELFLSVLSRLPTDDERKDITELLTGASDRRGPLADVIWALVTSSEFRFNH